MIKTNVFVFILWLQIRPLLRKQWRRYLPKFIRRRLIQVISDFWHTVSNFHVQIFFKSEKINSRFSQKWSKVIDTNFDFEDFYFSRRNFDHLL